MEEVEDIIPETEPQEEFPEEVEIIPVPEPPPLKRATNKLKDKVTCEGCGKSLSLHAYKYSHKCKARAPDEPPKAEPKEPKKESGKCVETHRIFEKNRNDRGQQQSCYD